MFPETIILSSQCVAAIKAATLKSQAQTGLVILLYCTGNLDIVKVSRLIVLISISAEPYLEVGVVVGTGTTGHILFCPADTAWHRLKLIPVAAIVPLYIQVFAGIETSGCPAGILDMDSGVASGTYGLFYPGRLLKFCSISACI